QLAEKLEVFSSLQEEAGDTAEARKLLEEVVVIRTRLHGESAWQTADARRALADLELRARLPEEGRALLKRAAELKAQYSEMYKQGHFKEAAALVQEALTIYKRWLGESHPTYAGSLDNLAAIHASMGDDARAESLFLQALEI